MRIEETKKDLLGRRNALQDWLSCEAPYAPADQRHLDAHTPEQAYWHLGYAQALSDLLSMISSPSGPLDSEDTSSPNRQDD